MGLCASNLSEEHQRSRAIDNLVQQDRAAERDVVKLLLLGTGESGKSTIFKQMQIIHKEGFSDYEKKTYKHVVRRNVVESMQTLLKGAARFGFRLSSADSEAAAKFILELDPLSADFWVEEIVENIHQLWQNNEEAVIQAYANKSRLQLPDSAPYLFKNIDRIALPGYTPSDEDILRARLRTSGIVEKNFKIQNVNFQFLDVGGQRNERRKWIHCFENVTAVIFVAAISEYDQVLYEDEKENRLIESLRVFDTVCNNKYFERTAMILFLNKTDLFHEKIVKTPLSVCFSDYEGADGAAKPAMLFLKEKFTALNHFEKELFCHFTCATDTSNVERVFNDCKAVILRDNLERLGLV